VGQPFTTREEVEAAYASRVSSFRILRSAFPDFQPREGWRVREIELAPNELLVINRSRERTIVPE
jgi:hypothetical protein